MSDLLFDSEANLNIRRSIPDPEIMRGFKDCFRVLSDDPGSYFYTLIESPPYRLNSDPRIVVLSIQFYQKNKEWNHDISLMESNGGNLLEIAMIPIPWSI